MKKRHIEHAPHILILVIILLALMMIGAGCGAIKISELKENPEEYMGKEIMVRGTVSNTIKIGSISGFTLVDGEAKLLVSSKELPAENKTVTVKGTLMKEVLIGYYLYATEIY